MKKTVFLSMLLLAGSYIAYTAGSGFGTGQEVMQYFVSYGTLGIVGQVVSCILWTACAVFIVVDVRRYGLTSLKDVFVLYCGKYLGTALFAVTFVYLFLLVGLMLAGAGASFAQYFGINPMVGRIIMAILVLTTCLLGLRRIIDVIGSIGPFEAIIVVVIGVIALIDPLNTMAEGNTYILTHDMLQPSSPSWIISAVMYCAISMTFQASFCAGLARTSGISTKKLATALVIGSAGFLAAALCIICAMITNISAVANTEVPAMVLGQMYSPWIATIFCVILLISIYTTVTPLVWAVTDVFVPEKTKWYPWIVIAIMVLSYIISGVASFAVLLNFIFNIIGWVGLLFIIPLLGSRLIRRYFKKFPLPPVVEADINAEPAVAASSAAAEPEGK